MAELGRKLFINQSTIIANLWLNQQKSGLFTPFVDNSVNNVFTTD